MENKTGISIYYQNVRGLRTKTNTFRRNVALCNSDVIAITETWLVDGIYDSELFDDRYSVFRQDRRYDLTHQSRGGGVLIATHKRLTTTERPEWSSSAEDSWISIKLQNCFLHVCAVYLCKQEGSDRLTYSQQLRNFWDKASEIINQHPSDKFLLLGDFNLRGINWISLAQDGKFSYYPGSSNSADDMFLLDEITSCGLSQYNMIANAYGRILDLILCNTDIIVSNCDDPLVPLDPYHKALITTLCLSEIESLNAVPRIKYLFHKANYKDINKDLAEVDWECLNSCLDVDDSTEKFYNIICGIRAKHVTKASVNISKFPCWYTPALKKVLKEKYRYYRKYRKYNMTADLHTLNFLTKRAKLLETECYNKYISNVEIQ